MKGLKEKLLNSSIQQVAELFEKFKKDGLSLEEIKELIFC